MATRQKATREGFTLLAPVDVWRRLQTYVQLCPIEISGFGVIERVNEHVFSLADVFIFEQEASDVHVTVSDEVMHRRLYQLDQAGLKLSTIRFQWHSHVNMEAYMSNVDEVNIDGYPGDWMISVVVNKRGDFEARLDVLKPLRLTIPVEVVVMIEPDEAISNELRAEIAEKVKTGKPGWFQPARKSVRTEEPDSIVVEQFVPSSVTGKVR